MQRRAVVSGICSLSLGFAGWGLDRVTAGIDWLAPVAIWVGGTGVAVSAAWLVCSYVKERIRKALPGFGAHMFVKLDDLRQPRRGYVFDVSDAAGRGAALYSTAKGSYAFVVKDEHGERYPLEIQGFPVGVPFYLAVEAGHTTTHTIMRALADGKVIAERSLPVVIDLGGLDVAQLTLGANLSKKEHGKFTLGESLILRATLSHADSRNMARSMREKYRTAA